jgi:hypothetical protein
MPPVESAIIEQVEEAFAAVTDNDGRGLLRSTLEVPFSRGFLEVPFSRGFLFVSQLQVSRRRRAFPRQSGCVHAGFMKRAG